MNNFQLKNFNLALFGNLLNQSLRVTPQLMLEFNNNMLKSCSFSQTKSLIKLWTIPAENLLINEENIVDVNDLSTITENKKIEIPEFNFYILRGDLFKNYMSVFSVTNSVDLTFNLIKIEDKMQASSIIIKGKSESGAQLETEFLLTTEELITNKISDYTEILRECTPSKDMFEFVLNNKQIIEVRGLIKKLHKSSVDNTAFLNFEISENKINIKDKVFSLQFENDITRNLINKQNINEKLNFNILKSDFNLIGDHTFSIFTNNETQKVIFGSTYSKSIIWCMSTKVGENHQNNENENFDDDDTIDSLSLSAYIDDLDS